MKIIIEPLKKSGVSIAVDAPVFSTLADGEKWQRAVKEILLFAFLDRPAWIVTVEPQTWSASRFLTAEKHTFDEPINGKNYRLYFQTACSAEFLEEIAAEDEFFRALLWFVSAPESGKAEIYEIVRAMDESERLKAFTPLVRREWLFAGFDYAEIVYWFNPNLPTDKILQKLNEIAASHDFEIDATAIA